MNKIFTVVMIVILSACNPTVNGWQHKAVKDICGDVENIDYTNNFLFLTVRCKNGDYMRVKPQTDKDNEVSS